MPIFSLENHNTNRDVILDKIASTYDRRSVVTEELRDQWLIDLNRQRKLDRVTYKGDGSDLPKEYRATGVLIPVEYALRKKVAYDIRSTSDLPLNTEYIAIIFKRTPSNPEYDCYTNDPYNKDSHCYLANVSINVDEPWFELYIPFGKPYFRPDQKKEAYKYFDKDRRKVLFKFISKNYSEIGYWYDKPWAASKARFHDIPMLQYFALNFKV